MSMDDDDGFRSPCEEGEAEEACPDTMPSERCDQCGAPRQGYQAPEDTRCPCSKMPKPYPPCNGTLRRIP